MAIVINGSGTITGISTGGLPDGIVDDGTLANDAVTLAKMASGTDGEVITYDASGNPTTVSVGTSGHVLTSTGAGSAPTMQASAVGGKVLRVISVTKDDTTTIGGSTAWSDVSGMTISITPTASTNKILVIASINVSHTNHANIRMMRGSTAIGGGVASSSRPGVFGYANTNGNTSRVMPFNYLDSPNTTASTTYKIQCNNTNSGSTTYFNRTPNDTDGAYGGRGASTITLIEVGA